MSAGPFSVRKHDVFLHHLMFFWRVVSCDLQLPSKGERQIFPPLRVRDSESSAKHKGRLRERSIHTSVLQIFYLNNPK